MSAIYKLVEAEILLQKFADFYDGELEARPNVMEESSDPTQDYLNQIALLELCKEAKELLRRKTMIKKDKIFSEVIWKTTFCFEDIYNNADDEFREKVNAMTTKELQKFFDKNLYGWEKGFESGIMFDWDSVADVLAQNSEFD